MKKMFAVLSAILIAALLFGCSSSKTGVSENSLNDYYYESKTGQTSAADRSSTKNGVVAATYSERMYVRNGTISMETLEFDRAVSELASIAAKNSGFIQGSRVSGDGAVNRGYYSARYASYVFRIPAANFDAFIEEIGELGSITDRNTFIDDVTDDYFDSKIRLETLTAQKDRLRELISQAKDISDIITLEKALEETLYNIESIEGRMKSIESRVEYSTIELSLREVFEPSSVKNVPVGFGERVRDRFSNSLTSIKNGLADIGVFILGDIIQIVFILGVISLAVFFILRRKRRSGAKTAPEAAAEDPKE